MIGGAAPAGAAGTAEADVVRVLLVEDDDAHAALERRLFQRAGLGHFAIDRVASGAAALARSAHAAYDAVVADYRLGDVDGIALVVQLRQAGVQARAASSRPSSRRAAAPASWSRRRRRRCPAPPRRHPMGPTQERAASHGRRRQASRLPAAPRPAIPKPR